MTRPFAIAAASLLSLLSLPGAGLAEDAGRWEKLIERAKLSLAEAVDAGLERCGDGVAFHVEMEEDGGRVVFSVDVAQGTKTCNAVVDAKDGKLVEQAVEDEDHAAAIVACKVALKAAIETALAHRAGTAVEAKLSISTGHPVVAVKVVAGGKLESVSVDGVTGTVMTPVPPKPEAPFTDAFRVEPAELASSGTNPWFVLEPGYVLVLEGKDGGENVRLTITVLDETKTIDGVETRVVEEREEASGRLIEVSRNFFAISKRTNSVYYFGEEVDEYEGGRVVGHPGAWRSGDGGARFGLMMPGLPLLGARYHQEVAPGVAMDRAEIVGLAEKLETPAGTFADCLKIAETTPLEDGKREHKFYAPGVGLVRDGPLRLAKRERRA